MVLKQKAYRKENIKPYKKAYRKEYIKY